jgi:UDPglucose 6-dehydrogenase
MKIGFVGQGFIGKNYADDFEERGLVVTRYALEPAYSANKDRIRECDVVFIAVPTPTTPEGFDASALRSALSLLKDGAVAVIKSTIIIGTTELLQKEFPRLLVLHSPEFLREKQAAYDARHPSRNIVGIPEDTPTYRQAAQRVLALLPRAPYEAIVSSRTAELLKYAGNCFLMTKVIFMNVLYDMAQHKQVPWDTLVEALAADPRIGPSHMQPVHESGHGGGAKRGAGGHCFIKDFAAFTDAYASVSDERGLAFLEAVEAKNNELLLTSDKDTDLLRSVYGKNPLLPRKRVHKA